MPHPKPHEIIPVDTVCLWSRNGSKPIKVFIKRHVDLKGQFLHYEGTRSDRPEKDMFAFYHDDLTPDKMKFFINDTISYQEIYSAIHAYMNETQGCKPSYLLIHPETRRKILIATHDAERGLNYSVVHTTISHDENHPVKSIYKMFGLYLIQSEDVEPNFIIVCG